MEKSLKYTLIVIILVVLLTGCKTAEEKAMEEKREFIDSQYVHAIFNDSIFNNDADDFVKTNNDNYIKWTAHVKEIESDRRIVLQEEGLPKIEARFNYDVNKNNKIEVGNIITISGNLKTYIHGLFGTTPKWIFRNCRIERTTETEQNVISVYYQKKDEEVTVKEEVTNIEEKEEAIVEEEAKVDETKVNGEIQLDEEWTKENIIKQFSISNVLDRGLQFSNKNFGSKVIPHDESSYGETNIKDAYCLELTLTLEGETIHDENLMKETVFEIGRFINDNYNKMDFNLCIVGIHFDNVENLYGAGGDNFYIGTNILTNYFSEPRSNKVGISGGTGDIIEIDFDYDSFYEWIENNFSLPEDYSVLSEDTSWTTISIKAIP